MHVQKQYERSFLLEPTKLSRIVDTIHQRLGDHPDTFKLDRFEIFSTGNRRDLVTSLGAVLDFDNTRRHEIERLLLTCTASRPGATIIEHEVQVDFGAPKPGPTPTNGKLVTVAVQSNDSGWASRTLAEVEEQIERTWQSVTVPLVTLVLLLFGVLVLIASQFLYVQPEASWRSMWLDDRDMPRVQALLAPGHTLTESELREIATLQLRNVAVTKRAPPPMTPQQRQTRLYLVIPLSLVLVCTLLLVTTAYPYNLFLWGDEIDRYARAIQRRKILWSLVAGMTIAGVSANLLFAAFSRWP